MSASRPEFHLRRVLADGSAGPVEVYRVHELPEGARMSRRGFMGAGVAMGSVLAAIGGCGREETRRVTVASAPPPVAPVAAAPAAAVSAGVQAEPEAKGPPEKEPEQPQADDTGSTAGVVYAHAGSVNALAFLGDPNRLASGSDDKTVKLWDLVESKPLRTLTDHGDHVTSLAVSPDGRRLASGSWDTTVKIWSLPEGNLLLSLAVHRGKVVALAVSPDGKLLASGSADRTVRLWPFPPAGGTPLQTLNGDDAIDSLAVTPDGKVLAAGFPNGTGKLWALPEGRFMQNTKENWVRVAAFTPDSRVLAFAARDRTVKLWDWFEGKALVSIGAHDDGATCLAITPDGRTLISGSSDWAVKLWSIPDGKLLRTLLGHRADLRALAVAPDGKTLASGDKDGVIILWDLPSGKRRSYLFDPKASKTDGFVYSVRDRVTGQVITYTLPCGAPIPPGATCVCNCVPGTYQPAPPPPPPTITYRPAPAPPPPVTYQPAPSMPAPSMPLPSFPSGGGGFTCTCDTICTCIPICQAHRLLHPDAVVRTMAEELLLVMGAREFAYMRWATERAEAALATAIRRVMDAIRNGASPDPARWPGPRTCAAFLDSGDEVVAVMAAQMLRLRQLGTGLTLDAGLQAWVDALVEGARRRPWFARGDSGSVKG
jgi:hypothetical protein